MKKQDNYTKYLNTLNYTVSFSEDRIIFHCPENHMNDLTLTSFANLKAKANKNNSSLCVECRNQL